MDLLLGFGILLLIGVCVGYPYIQESRERKAVERLKDNHDPNAAMVALDSLRAQSQQEAGFFRTIANWFSGFRL